MKYLFDYWDKLKGPLSSKFVMLFLDYDGTLAPIAKRPEEAAISVQTKQILRRLTKARRIKLAVISGRRLEDVKKLVGLKDIIYAGNHGFEIEGPKIKFTNQGLIEYRKSLGKIKEELDKKLSNIKGVFLEDKGITLAVHYRLADKKDIPLIKTIFQETLIFYRIKDKVRVGTGKMLLEVRPPINWDKGKVALWLLARQRFAVGGKKTTPIYIGDDTTDEDAFKALKGRGLTIFVGKPRDSHAEYFLKNTKDVARFLGYICRN